MAVLWTEDQRKAIETHGGNILVAAAAGSGKTAVLVERVIGMITDKENPVSVDRLLMLTFTDLAASEMKRKIAAAIEKKLEENPDSEWLREQSIKVGSASISTIHSFCSRIISNNIHLTDLPTDYTLINPIENKVLQRNAVDEVLESYYAHIDSKPEFKELVMGWGGIKGDGTLRDMIVSLHNFSRSLPYPRMWFREKCTENYAAVKESSSIDNTAWSLLLKKMLYGFCLDIIDGLNAVCDMTDREVPSDDSYYSYYLNMKSSFMELFNKIDIEADHALGELIALFNGYAIPGAPRNGKIGKELSGRLNSVRDDFVKGPLGKGKNLISLMNGESIGFMTKCAPIVKKLSLIVRQVEKVHRRYKRERSTLDFSDLEYETLKLLRARDGSDTPLCLKLREFYHEILLDEFQDTNALQFEIFKHLSKTEGNLFMVGDVKQCIYKFRNADPSIFMSCYKKYGKGDGGTLIRLFKNFRSRSEVVDSVNYVFSEIMSDRTAGIDYTEEEYLVCGADYPSGSGYSAEILITDVAEEKDTNSELVGLSKEQIEAKNLAERIKRLIEYEKIKVTDARTGELRCARYGDAAILCRGRSEALLAENALSELGIGVLSDTSQQYLDSVEVNTLLSFLQIIDNPIQDIPLIAVMRSAIFGFDAEELAHIRTYSNGRYYYAVANAAAENPKAAKFLEALNELRKCSKYMGVDELVWKICYELNYFAIVGSMQNGSLRQANLKLLMIRSSEYERGTLTGVFNFIKYIEMLKENVVDIPPAKEILENEDAVKIMTIHKSKGLEFPIVLLLGMGKSFNMKDCQKSVVWDEEWGIGIDYIDTKQRVRYSQLSRGMISEVMAENLKAEEMRLLYVAMTRAKEKLIISTPIMAISNRWKGTLFDENMRIYPCIARSVLCQRDWILGAFLSHPSAARLREFAGRTDIVPRIDLESELIISFADELDYVSNIPPAAVNAEVETGIENMAERLSYEYNYSLLGSIPIKMSVSELKRRKMPGQDFSAGLLKAPSELRNSASEMSATEIGVITHYVMQHLSIDKTGSAAEIQAQIAELVQSGIISSEQAAAVDTVSLVRFFESPLGKRLQASKHIEREYDFYMLIPPEEIETRLECDYSEEVILQGIADCFFYEDDGIVLIDYKTDRVSADNARERSKRYALQIECYTQGLSKILDAPIKERYIYFLSCGEAVEM